MGRMQDSMQLDPLSFAHNYSHLSIRAGTSTDENTHGISVSEYQHRVFSDWRKGLQGLSTENRSFTVGTKIKLQENIDDIISKLESAEKEYLSSYGLVSFEERVGYFSPFTK